MSFLWKIISIPFPRCRKLRFRETEKFVCGLTVCKQQTCSKRRSSPGRKPRAHLVLVPRHLYDRREWGWYTARPSGPAASISPLKLDHSKIRHRSRSSNPALMITPRVSNYNREGRSREPLFLNTKLTLIPSDTVSVQIVGKALVEELRNLLRLEGPLLPTQVLDKQLYLTCVYVCVCV